MITIAEQLAASQQRFAADLEARLKRGVALRELRTWLGLTQQQAADLLGASTTTVWRWENGVSWTPENACALLEARGA